MRKLEVLKMYVLSLYTVFLFMSEAVLILFLSHWKTGTYLSEKPLASQDNVPHGDFFKTRVVNW